MGMVRCEVHGLSHITQHCCHVGVAVDAGHPERAFVEIDGWNNPYLMCTSCHAKALDVLARSRGRADPGERFNFDFGDGPSEGCCTRCITEWFRGTGQGELSKAVAEARLRDGRPA